MPDPLRPTRLEDMRPYSDQQIGSLGAELSHDFREGNCERVRWSSAAMARALITPPAGSRAADLEVLLKKIAELRTAQRKYFRTRDYAQLDECREREKEVDKLIEKITAPPTLF